MKKLLLACFCLLMFKDAESQTLFKPLRYYNTFAMFDLCRNYYNPAFTGFEEKPSLYIMSSYQYQKYVRPLNDPSIPNIGPSGIRFQTFDLSTPILIRGKQKFGAGLNYSRIQEGFDATNDLRLNLAWQHEIGKGKLLLGANADLLKDIADYKGVYTRATRNQEDYSMNAGFGIAYHSLLRNFYAGLSTNHIIHNKLILEEVGEYYRIYKSNYYLSTGIDIPLGKQFMLKPSFIAYRLPRWGINSSLALEFRERCNIGLTYNTVNGRTGVRVGFKWKGLSLNYTYGFYLSRMQSFTSGVHSFGINYVFGQKA